MVSSQQYKSGVDNCIQKFDYFSVHFFARFILICISLKFSGFLNMSKKMGLLGITAPFCQSMQSLYLSDVCMVSVQSYKYWLNSNIMQTIWIDKRKQGKYCCHPSPRFFLTKIWSRNTFWFYTQGMMFLISTSSHSFYFHPIFYEKINK